MKRWRKEVQAWRALLHETSVPLDHCLPGWRLHTAAQLESL